MDSYIASPVLDIPIKMDTKTKFDEMNIAKPASIAEAEQYACTLLHEIKTQKGNITVGQEIVLSDARVLIDNMEVHLEFLQNEIADVSGRELIFTKSKFEYFTVGEICKFKNCLTSFGDQKKKYILKPVDDNTYSSFDNETTLVRRSTRLCVAQDCSELPGSCEEDAGAYDLIHKLSLLSFCLMEWEKQLYAWARLRYHAACLPEGNAPTDKTMIKWLKKNRETIDISDTVQLHRIHLNLLNHEDHINKPGIDDPTGCGVRYPKMDPKETEFEDLEEIVTKRYSGTRLTPAEYRKWLMSIEISFNDGPVSKKAETPEEIEATKIGWAICAEEVKRYFIKCMKRGQKPLPVDEKDLTLEHHIDPRAHNLAENCDFPPPRIEHLMADGKTNLQVQLKTGPCDASIGELQRVVNEDFGEGGGGIIALKCGTNAKPTRTYNNIQKHLTLVASKYIYQMQKSNGLQSVVHMDIAGNNAQNARKCMSANVTRPDPGGKRKYSAALTTQTIRPDHLYDEVVTESSDEDGSPSKVQCIE